MLDPVPMMKGKSKKGRKTTIANIQHPDYRVLITDYNRWRLTYQAGRRFVNAYLKRHSKRESAQEFVERRFMTYCPAFAKAAINEIKNSIYQRLCDIKRIGGDPTYQAAMQGQMGGVDMHGSSMMNFMGQAILMELLPMKKVGIYVDMPAISGETIQDTYHDRPYLYLYPTEDIRTWSYQYQDGQYQFNNVLLRDGIEVVNPETGMPEGTSHRWRRVWLDSDGVHIKFFDTSGEAVPMAEGGEIHLPKMKRIPFIVLELTDSLLVDASDYQISLLNLNSTDINYMIKSNFPFYTEEYDPRAENIYSQTRQVNGEKNGLPSDSAISKEIETGIMGGRRYPHGSHAPEFIHPSSEPITASMNKQTQMKEEIRELIGLALATLQPIHASAESKQQDQGTMESGLSVVGLTMEYAEREVAKVWGMYLGHDEDDCAKVNYPVKYSLVSDADRRENAKQLADLQPSAPSITFKKEIGKQIAHHLLHRKVGEDVMETINKEIDAAPYIDGTAISVQQDVASGLVSAETASLARGYKNAPEEVKTAKKESAEKLATIAQHQSKPVQGVPATQPAGGNKDANGDPLNPGAGRPPKPEGDS